MVSLIFICIFVYLWSYYLRQSSLFNYTFYCRLPIFPFGYQATANSQPVQLRQSKKIPQHNATASSRSAADVVAFTFPPLHFPGMGATREEIFSNRLSLRNRRFKVLAPNSSFILADATRTRKNILTSFRKDFGPTPGAHFFYSAKVKVSNTFVFFDQIADSVCFQLKFVDAVEIGDSHRQSQVSIASHCSSICTYYLGKGL